MRRWLHRIRLGLKLLEEARALRGRLTAVEAELHHYQQMNLTLFGRERDAVGEKYRLRKELKAAQERETKLRARLEALADKWRAHAPDGDDLGDMSLRQLLSCADELREALDTEEQASL